MLKFAVLIYCILFSSIKPDDGDCSVMSHNDCPYIADHYPDLEEHTLPEEYDQYAFQTPPRNDALGNYLSTFQDMRYIVGYAEYTYNKKKNYCTIRFITFVNPDLGDEGIDYDILYTFGDNDETDDNELSLNSRDDSYPNGLSASCRVINKQTQNEVVSLKLQDLYLMWDNVEVNLPDEYYKKGQRGSIVELFGWSLEDIGEECEFLGIAGYLGVKVFSPNEHLLQDKMLEGNTLNPWWYGTQVVSYKYDARVGNQKQLKKIINRCRSYNVRVYAEVVINHMTGAGNDCYENHTLNDCTHFGAKEGSAGSPFWRYGYIIENNPYTNNRFMGEYPSVPYFPSDFHCFSQIKNWDDPLDLSYSHFVTLMDINTEKEYPRQRIADFFTELISIGFSGISIANGRHIPSFSMAQILKKFKENLGNVLPDDLLIIILIEDVKMKLILCDLDSIINYGPSFDEYLKREKFNKDDMNKIKFWFKGCLAEEDFLEMYEPLCEYMIDIDVTRWVISLEYSDDINMATRE